jgi:hypothetical protein
MAGRPAASAVATLEPVSYWKFNPRLALPCFGKLLRDFLAAWSLTTSTSGSTYVMP